MTTNYAAQAGTRETPQQEPIPGKDQVENSAGGFAFAIDDWTRAERFLILGNEGGSYYADERKLTLENADAIHRCLDSDADRAVGMIVRISTSGRAPKNDPAIFALAMACAHSKAKDAATRAIPAVCRTGTHLFQFVDAVQRFRGWGRGLRNAVARWYTEKEPDRLAYQVTKYAQRMGWTHHDVLHKCHAEAPTPEHNRVFRYVKDGEILILPWGESKDDPLIVTDKLKRSESAKETAKIVKESGAVREWVKTEHLNDPDVWDALLERMPMTAMVRNLGKMSAVGLLKPFSAASELIASRLSDAEAVRKSKIHPMQILFALTTYKSGRGFRGSLTWDAAQPVCDALEGAFDASFTNVEPTGKRHLLALDVSGSMGHRIANSNLTCRDASAAMAMLTVRTELHTHAVGFTGGHFFYHGVGNPNDLSVLPFGRRDSIADAVRRVSNLPFGGTNCALPMLYAMDRKIDVDAFVVYTDSETWVGRTTHPCQALQRYREQTGIPAKLIVVGMASNGFTIADPNDGGMMDVVGFDASAPSVMADFVRG